MARLVEESSFLDDVESAVSYAVDSARDFGTGVKEGAVGLLGLPGEIANLIDPRSPYEQMMGGALTSGNIRRLLSGDAATARPAQYEGMGRAPTYRTGVGETLGAIGEQVVPTVAPVGRLAAAPGLLKRQIGEMVATGGAVDAARTAYPGDPIAEMAAGTAGSLSPEAAKAAVRGLLRPSTDQGGVEAMRQNIQQMENVGVTPTMGMATDKPSVQAVEGLLRIAPGSRTSMQRADDRFIDEIDQQLRTRVQDLAPRSKGEDAGRVVYDSIQEFMQGFRDRSAQLFDDIPIDDATATPAKNTQRFFVASTTPTEGAENLSGALQPSQLKTLAGAFAEDLADGKTIPYSALKQLRTTIGEKVQNSYLLDDMTTGQYKALYAAISRDMEDLARKTDLATATSEAPTSALAAFRRANRFYNAGATRIESRLDPVVRGRAGGKPATEDVYQRVKAGVNRGGTNVRAIRRSMRPDDWKAYQSAYLEDISKATAANQSVDAVGFDPNQFFRNYNNMSDGARSAMFGGEGGLQDALDDLSRVIEKQRKAKEQMANPSRTGETVTSVAGLLGGAGAVSGFAVTTDPSYLLGLGSYIFGVKGLSRFMTDPKFVKWVAQAPNMRNAADMRAHTARLVTLYANADDRTQSDVKSFARLVANN